ncbi:potassium channel family protein [Novilysobacter erysipheiresistens]|uniref:Potassium channel family protein n=1 Tax=Novilysobacter erysipheiresistens TaxID=1749332 RepID=A0ABU7YY77_9GAMM
MPLIGRLYRAVRAHLREVTWTALLTALALHVALCWALLALAGERELVGWDAFPYYYMTTATTIGYGDLSPSTTAGRFVVALLLMPVAIALLASVLGKGSATAVGFWKRHQGGEMSYHEMSGHTVLVGWRGRESARLVQLLLADTETDDEGIVLVAERGVEGLEQNPLKDQVRFIAVDSYADCDQYARAAVARAGRVIVHTGSDAQSLAAVFAVMAAGGSDAGFRGHVVAHFDGEAAASLVRSHYPQVECTRPLDVDVIARAAQDAGSSLVANEWLTTGGPTQFSLRVPDDAPALSAGKLAAAFRRHAGLWVGYRERDAATPVLNPADECTVAAGAQLYYLADRRIDSRHFGWPSLAVG